MKKILVIGSTNVDSIARVSHLPVAGETVGNAELNIMLGGKGANQAIAARRTGSNVSFLTSLGNDNHGENAKAFLNNEGLDLTYSKLCNKTTTGQAYIFVDKEGENFIAVSPGANAFLLTEDLDKADKEFEEAEIILLQMEIPYKTVLEACRKAKKHNTKVVLNPAPATKINKEILQYVDYLILNASETRIITGIESPADHIKESFRSLSLLGTDKAIITLGDNGCYYSNGASYRKFGAYHVESKDSTAAGDTFCGAFVSAILKGESDEEAIKYASAAAALTVTGEGAIESIPREGTINNFIKSEGIPEVFEVQTDFN